MIDTIGDSLLSGIKCWMATLKQQLEGELSAKLQKLQLVTQELEAPGRFYQQMKALLKQHSSMVQFLHRHKRLKAKMQRLHEGSVSPQITARDTISIRCYFQELVKGVDITVFIPSEPSQVGPAQPSSTRPGRRAMLHGAAVPAST